MGIQKSVTFGDGQGVKDSELYFFHTFTFLSETSVAKYPV